MDVSDESPPYAGPKSNPSAAGWPRVVGTIGIVLGVLIFLDQLDDLWLGLTWTEEHWRRFLSAEMAAFMAAALRPTGWQLASTVIQVALGIMLVVGSIRLHRRRRSGVSLCRSWSWLAIAWVVIEIGWAIWLLSRYGEAIPSMSAVSWQAAAAFGVSLALVMLLAYPVFLLVWLARPDVKAEYVSWAE